jgi:hypothetical protein
MKPSISSILGTYKYISKNTTNKIYVRKWFSNEEFFYELAYFVAKIMGDGHLSKNLGSCSFSDENQSSIEKLQKLMIKYFGLDKNQFKIRRVEAWGKSWKLDVFDSLFSRLLYVAGAPKGKKVETPFHIPKWINKNNKYSLVFLQGILEDELTTVKIENKNYAVGLQFKMAKMEDLLPKHYLFMRQIKKKLEDLGIECGNLSTIRSNKKAKTWDVYFAIQRNKRNIICFKENVGFRLESPKKKLLFKTCKILQKTLQPIMDKNKILALREQGLSIRQVAKETGINRSTIHRFLQKV